ncbi:MAG: methyltransferase domain-containing protein [Candidatus Firestonebacteria bacterium]|nr:methyltransferase domain-containing protein [Candidatus Firestonebacteria bacterium]
MHKKIIQKHFSQKAKTYDKYAILPQNLAKYLIEYISVNINLLNPSNGLILDIGTGTGDLLLQLANIFTQASIIGCDIAPGMIKEAQKKIKTQKKIKLICADAENIPLLDNSCNLLISNATYQWIFNLLLAFQEAHRILLPGGKFVFTIFGSQTLHELVEAGSHKVKHIKFKNKEELQIVLEQANFVIDEFKIISFTLYYPDVFSLLQSMKNMGAGNIFWEKGLGGRTFLKNLDDNYSKFFKTEKGLPATFEAYLISASKLN